jgi:predicted Zn-dependent protease
MLSELVAAGSTDPFHHYALANEYRREHQIEEAWRVFEGLRASHPDYLPMYMMAGLLLVEMGRADQARDWFSAGVEIARRQGDSKTARELADALART